MKKPILLHFYNPNENSNKSETMIVEEVHPVITLGPSRRAYSGIYVTGFLGNGQEARCAFYETPDKSLPPIKPTLVLSNPDGSIKDVIELDDYELVYEV